MGRSRDRASGDFDDLNITNVGTLQLDSIYGDGDGNTSLAFSGSDVITVTTGGTVAATIDDAQNLNLLTDSAVLKFGADGDINLTHQHNVGLTTNGDFTVGDDLILSSDSSVIKFGADSEVTLTHNHNTGLLLKTTATADDNPILLTLQTGETDLAANDVIGKIAFQAPDEATGTDAVLVSAAIQAVAEGDHSSSSNATSLQFMTGSSEAAAEKVRIDSAGNVAIGNSSPSSQYMTRLVVGDGSGTEGITIYSGNDSQGRLEFSDDTSGDGRYAGGIVYEHNNNALRFNTNGGNERMRIDSTGAITMPSQPVWWAHNNSAGNHGFSGADSWEQIAFNVETLDKNSDFASNTFTAPVDGTYYANASVMFNASSSGTVRYDLAIYVNSTLTLYSQTKDDNYSVATDVMSVSGLVDCDASDTVKVYARVSDTKGNIYLSPTSAYFQGYLVA